METAKKVLQTIEDYGFWMTICICIVNFCVSLPITISQRQMKPIFEGFQIVALIAAIIVVILTIKKTRKPEYFESAEDIAANMGRYMIAIPSAVISLVWLFFI